MCSKGLLVRSRIVRCSSAIATVMYMNYIGNVCIMRMQETVCVGNSYKYSTWTVRELLDALVIVQYMHAVYNCFYGKWFARDRGLYKEARSSGKVEGWWQANQSVKTISIYRRAGVNSDCGAVSAVGRVSAFLARGSVTAIGSTPVLAWSSLSAVLRHSLWGRADAWSVSQARKCERAMKSRQQTGSQRAVGVLLSASFVRGNGPFY